MAVSNKNTKGRPADDFLRIQDLFYLCVAKWYWFVISLVITLSVAVIYILRTPPVYTRSASLLIKEEGNNKSMNDAAGVLGDIDIFQSSTNINNEILALQSPAVMEDVVRRLHLDVNYTTDGRFYQPVLYGRTCPYTVEFTGLKDDEQVAFTIHSGQVRGQVRLTDFNRAGEDLPGEVNVAFYRTVSTPVGRVTVMPSTAVGSSSYSAPVYVSRTSIQAASEHYAAGLSVALNDEKSTVLNLTFQDVSTQRAEDVLNTLITVYNENWVKDKNQVAVSTSMFINDRLGVIERELGHVDENISSYKSRNLLPDVQAAASMYMNQSSEAGAQIMSLNNQLAMTRYVRDYLTRHSSQNQLLPANSGIDNSAIESQITEYNTLQLQRNNLVANSSVDNPLVAEMDRSLQNMRRTIISSIDNHIVTLTTQLRSMQQHEQQTTARIAANPTQGRHLLSAERQQKVKEELYLFLLQKREENELSQAFTAYNSRIISPPTGSMVPTAPLKKNILLVALAIGILAPVLIIFLRESMNTKVRGRKDLESLSLPFAGEVPLNGGKSRKSAEGQSTIVIQRGSRNIINEAFRVLRTNLEFMFDAEARSTVALFTSFNPGSGKTFLAVNIAATFALKGKRVLAIDSDLRRASLSAYVGSPHRGLSDYLAKRETDLNTLLVAVPDCPGFDLLPVGTVPPNPTELLAESRFDSLLEELRSRYDYIFIDCPPVEVVADTQIIEKRVDRTLFVVRAGLLERDMLPELQRVYEEKRYRNMAVILNGTTGGRSRYGYHYGYGSKNYYGSK